MASLNLESVIGFSGGVAGGLVVHPNREQIVYPLGSSVIVERISGKKAQLFLRGHTTAVSCVAISPSGRFVAAGQKTQMGFTADVIIWDFKTQQVLFRLTQHKASVASVVFSPSDKFLVSIGGKDDGSVLVWDVATGQAVSGSSLSQQPTSGFAETVVYANTSDYQFITGGQGVLRVWELDKTSMKLNVTDCKLGSIRRDTKCIVVSPDDEFAYCGTTTGDIMQIAFRTKLFKGAFPEKTKYSLGVISLAYTKGGDLIIGAGDGTVSMVKAGTWKVVKSTKLEGGISSVALRGDGHEIFVGTSRSEIYRVAVADFAPELRQVSHPSKINQIEFAPGTSDLFATCSSEDVRVWHTPTNKEMLRITVPNQECFSLSFMPDGKAIITGWNDGKIRAFLPQSGKLKYEINNAHNKGVTAVAAAADGTKVVSGGGDGLIRVWKIGPQSQTLVESLKEHKSHVTSIKLKASGEACVSSSADGTCIVWDLVKFVRSQIIFAASLFAQVTYVPDESQVVTCGSDKKIASWDVYDGSLIRELSGSVGPLNGLDVSTDGKLIVSGGQDQLVKVWKYKEGEVFSIGGGQSGEITDIKICAAQKYIISVSTDGAIFRWAYPTA
eukprot:m.14334 g.14334  ORF g.14334 m.14334 type:complete len:611 (+) comp22175_c0_seq1:135-1967(+)